MTEEWRPVVGFPAYAVSSLGRVRRPVASAKGHPPMELRPWPNNKGYLIVGFSADGNTSRQLVSRAVCEAFHGPAPSPLHEAAHGDGNHSRNHADNLRWATKAENMADCVVHGTRAIGDKHGRTTKPERTPRGSVHGHSKITESDVLAIRSAPRLNGSGVRLAAQYGISTGAISLIRSRKTWSHI